MNTKTNSKTKNSKQSKSIQRTNPPIAKGLALRTTGPRVRASNDGISIHRREFCGSFTNGAVTTFQIAPLSTAVPGYDFNPGCPFLFPWLGNIAAAYERYAFKALKFHVVPSAPTTTPGRYYMSVDYDYDDPVPTTKQGMMGNRQAVEAPAWQECTLECDPRELHRDMPSKYINVSGRNNFVEARTSYAGFLIIGMDVPSTYVTWDLWVEYDIDLFIPTGDLLSLQDSFSGAATLPTAAVTSAVGTGYAGLPPISSVPGPVRVVIPGAGDTPILRCPIGGAYINATQAIDLATCNGRGSIDFEVRVDGQSTSPSSELSTKNTAGEVMLFDNAGTYLGYISSTIQRIIGVQNPGSITVAGAAWFTIFSSSVAALYAAYSKVRYAAILVNGSAASGSGNWIGGFRYQV